MKDFFQVLLLRTTTFMSKTIAKVYMPFTRKRLSSKNYRELKSLMMVGDVLVSRVDGELSSVFIPDFWTHAGIIKDENTVVEATTHNVIETDLIDFVMKKDYVALLRPSFCTPIEREFAAFEATQQLGKPYDYGMTYSGVESFFCSELVYYCYSVAVKHNPFKLNRILGKTTVIPSDFYNAKDKFDLVYEAGK
jgi:uncharacterized protein YycO